MTITPTTVAGTIFAIGIIAALIRAVRNAPIGYQSEHGFRYGTPDEPGEEMTVEQLERLMGGDR